MSMSSLSSTPSPKIKLNKQNHSRSSQPVLIQAIRSSLRSLKSYKHKSNSEDDAVGGCSSTNKSSLLSSNASSNQVSRKTSSNSGSETNKNKLKVSAQKSNPSVLSLSCKHSNKFYSNCSTIHYNDDDDEFSDQMNLKKINKSSECNKSHPNNLGFLTSNSNVDSSSKSTLQIKESFRKKSFKFDKKRRTLINKLKETSTAYSNSHLPQFQVIHGISNVEVRKKLLKLQRQHREFSRLALCGSNGGGGSGGLAATSSGMASSASRRKMAFVADYDYSTSLSDFEYEEAYHASHFVSSSYDEGSSKENDLSRLKLSIKQLTSSIYSLSLSLTDEQNQRVSSANSAIEISQDAANANSNTNTTNANDDKNVVNSNDVGRVARWALGFEKLLEDALGLQIFTEFLKKEFSEENIDFWVICENYKKITDPEEQKKEAQNIWNLYLDTSSLHQINVDNKARSRCKEAMQGDSNSSIFEMAQTQIYNLMKYDSYSRFLKSQMYKDCIINEIEGKPVISLSSNTNSRTNKNELTHQTSSSSQIQNVNWKASGSNLTNTVNTINSSLINNSNQNILTTQSSCTGSILNNDNNHLTNTIPNGVAILQNPGGHFPSSSLVSNNLNILTGSIDPSSSGATAAALASNNTISHSSKENKDKKKTTIILPWTKALIKWKRLSGGAKKQNDEQQPHNPTLTSGVAATLGRGFAQKTPLLLSASINDLNSQLNDPMSSATPALLDHVYFNASGVNNTPIDSKFCRIYCNYDGSSTMIQVAGSNATVYQILIKILQKKNLPWYKIDVYFLTDNKPVDPLMEAHLLGSKEIVIAERSLFILSLIPIAINLCVKANKKKNIIKVLQPILDHYQIKTNNCIIYLNSANYTLNLYDYCSTIDNQHLLVVHKHQSNMLSLIEIDKYVNMSVKDFIPTTSFDMSIQFDDYGIMKQFNKNAKTNNTISSSNINSPTVIVTNSSASITSNDSIQIKNLNISNNNANCSSNKNDDITIDSSLHSINSNQQNQQQPVQIDETVQQTIYSHSPSNDSDQDTNRLNDCLFNKQAQNLCDQQSMMNNKNLEVVKKNIYLSPESNTKLNKKHISISQIHLHVNTKNNRKKSTLKTDQTSLVPTYSQNYLNNRLSNILLPKQASTSLNSLPILNLTASETRISPCSTSSLAKAQNNYNRQELNSLPSSRSRSPIVILNDYFNLNLNEINDSANLSNKFYSNKSLEYVHQTLKEEEKQEKVKTKKPY